MTTIPNNVLSLTAKRNADISSLLAQNLVNVEGRPRDYTVDGKQVVEAIYRIEGNEATLEQLRDKLSRAGVPVVDAVRPVLKDGSRVYDTDKPKPENDHVVNREFLFVPAEGAEKLYELLPESQRSIVESPRAIIAERQAELDRMPARGAQARAERREAIGLALSSDSVSIEGRPGSREVDGKRVSVAFYTIDGPVETLKALQAKLSGAGVAAEFETRRVFVDDRSKFEGYDTSKFVDHKVAERLYLRIPSGSADQFYAILPESQKLTVQSPQTIIAAQQEQYAPKSAGRAIQDSNAPDSQIAEHIVKPPEAETHKPVVAVLEPASEVTQATKPQVAAAPAKAHTGSSADNASGADASLVRRDTSGLHRNVNARTRDALANAEDAHPSPPRGHAESTNAPSQTAPVAAAPPSTSVDSVSGADAPPARRDTSGLHGNRNARIRGALESAGNAGPTRTRKETGVPAPEQPASGVERSGRVTSPARDLPAATNAQGFIATTQAPSGNLKASVDQPTPSQNLTQGALALAPQLEMPLALAEGETRQVAKSNGHAANEPQARVAEQQKTQALKPAPQAQVVQPSQIQPAANEPVLTAPESQSATAAAVKPAAHTGAQHATHQTSRGAGLALGVHGLKEKLGKDGSLNADDKAGGARAALAHASVAGDAAAMASDTAHIASDIAKATAATSRAAGALAGAAESLGRRNVVIAAGAGVLEASTAIAAKDGHRAAAAIGGTVGGLAVGAAASIAGAKTGAIAGAYVGSLILTPGVGTVVGTVVGTGIGAIAGFAGGYLGAQGGSKIADSLAGDALHASLNAPDAKASLKASLEAAVKEINDKPELGWGKLLDGNKKNGIELVEVMNALKKTGVTMENLHKISGGDDKITGAELTNALSAALKAPQTPHVAAAQPAGQGRS